MKKHSILPGVVIMMILSGLTVSGCSVGGLFLKDHDSFARESWAIRNPSPDILEAIADTGGSMGFDVAYGEMTNPPPGLEYRETPSPPPLDKGDWRFRSIILSRDQLNGFKAAFMGWRNVSGLTFYVWRGGEYMDVYVMVDGDLGTGTQEAAMKLLSDFRTRLSKRIGEVRVLPEAPSASPPAA